jgi:pimeloyl-ACP methyl ester carboxylesterase
MSIPVNANGKSPAIVFLHGYGGSFIWYLHWLAEAFPDHIIIAPAYGISPVSPSFTYLAESVAAASKRLGFELSKPTLIGLSAGVFGVCRAFVKNPDRYARLICLAGFPPEDVLQQFGRTQQVHFIAGASEPFVTFGKFRTTVQTVRTTCPAATMTLIPDADHFFMLSHQEETTKALKAANP